MLIGPQTAHRGELLRAFTAIGRIRDQGPYLVESTAGVEMWRRGNQFLPCSPVRVTSLLPSLRFGDNPSWEARFRFAGFPIGEDDFTVIREAMVS